MKVLGFAGYSGAGKTTLIEQLIPRFTRKGLRVSLIKHAHHSFDIDKPGKDSYRHREAGASEVMLVSTRRWALLHELRDEQEPSLDEQLSRMTHCDLILVEGFKTSPIPKIEVYRPALGKPRFRDEHMNIIALACDTTIPAADSATVPQLDLNNPDEIASFILDYLELVPNRHRSPAEHQGHSVRVSPWAYLTAGVRT
jgi:molybdopterin-guanine dinucleotide biosynthesis adapter protein